MLSLELATSSEIAAEIGRRARARRLALGYTQKGVADRAGMSVGSLKRFEHRGAITFEGLVRVAVVLDALDGLRDLFAPAPLASLDALDASRAAPLRQRGSRP